MTRSALLSMLSLTHLTQCVLLPGLCTKGGPPLGNWMSIARPPSNGAICYGRLSLSLLTTARLPELIPTQIKCLFVPAISHYLVGSFP